ncbi:MAG: J domain-containing protein [Rhodospirillaceae bacterium]
MPCASAFRDAAQDLADRRGVNVADLARSILLLTPPEALAVCPDPGGPEPGDREEVVLNSGPSAGRPWRRKPRLQLRLGAGYDPITIRKALGVALSLDRKEISFALTEAQAPPETVEVGARPQPDPTSGAEALVPTGEGAAGSQDLEALRLERDQLLQTLHQLRETLEVLDGSNKTLEEQHSTARNTAHKLQDDVDRLRTMVSLLLFDPLPNGVNSRPEALYVLGFAPSAFPSSRDIKLRFRNLAQVHHPDSSHGDHARMSQLNAAMEYLRRP